MALLSRQEIPQQVAWGIYAGEDLGAEPAPAAPECLAFDVAHAHPHLKNPQTPYKYLLTCLQYARYSSP